ncbi:MAG: DUF1670 domain-containing protein [Trueperaceae bacterium]|nr:DUF1670 domain-containing protein [Trueperaceae bacterium]
MQANPPASGDAYLQLHGTRMARALSEAYLQDGLLSFTELQWIFLASHASVSRAIDHYQRTHHVILPCPGTVLDMGRMLTHKDLIIKLHLQGHTVLEISDRTHHNPRSIDAYLKTFDAVLILKTYHLPTPLIATVLGHGQELIHEYLDIIDAYLKPTHAIREHLQQRGVTIPTQTPHAG